MENNIEELTRQYEALWENDAPMEQIVKFCRRYSRTVLEDEHGKVPLNSVLEQSRIWGDMVLQPSFLKHLADSDDCLLRAIGTFFRQHPGVIYRILSMKKGLSDRIRAFFWTLMRKASFRIIINESTLLVDNNDIGKWIVKNKFRGYERIPAGLYFAQWPLQGWLITTEMRNAIEKDSVSLFDLELTLMGKRVTIGLLRRLLHNNSWNIVLHLLKHRTKQVTSILSPHDLLICICAGQSRSDAVVKVLDALEELFPGISQRTDKLGNTPLWYCLYHRSPEDSLVQALIRYDCNPDQRNHLNLNYRICAEVQNLIGNHD